MIVSLRGTVIDITAHHAVIECAGVGYQVLATPTTLGHLTRGAETFILITMIVREESQTLYGFFDAATRDMFATLQTVSGLGPKLALAAQSVYTTPELAHAITHGDTKTLQKIPGVGKRMAERMVVDLKDKVATYAAPETPTPAVPHTDTYEQVLEALASLGFAEKTAEPVLTTVLAADPTLTTPAALRASLNLLGKHTPHRPHRRPQGHHQPPRPQHRNRHRNHPPAPQPRRIHWPTQSARPTQPGSHRGEKPQRHPRPCAPLRAAGTRQNHHGHDYRLRNGHQPPHDLRARPRTHR